MIVVSSEATGTKYDTSQRGLRALYPDYLAELADHMVDGDPRLELTTAQAWRWLVEVRGYDISRASVIYGMRALEYDNVLASREASGKGGYHKVYTRNLDRGALNAHVRSVIEAHLRQNFPTG